MQRKIYLVILVLFSASLAGAQEISREQKIEELRVIRPQIEQTRAKLDELRNRRETISEDILAVSSQDIDEAEKVGAEAERLFPAGLLENLILSEDDTDFSAYSFDQISDYHYAPSFRYENNALVFEKISNRFGLIENIGGTFIETINEQNREFIALAKYEIPKDFKKVENEFSFNGVTFKNKVSIIVGNTYLVRAFNNSGGDGIFAVKIHRKDSDGSIVILVKLIKDFSRNKEITDNNGEMNFESPQPVADYATQQAITDALYQKGFYNITVEATTTEVTVRGTVPKGKMAEMMQTAQETAKRKVNNQVLEER